MGPSVGVGCKSTNDLRDDFSVGMWMGEMGAHRDWRMGSRWECYWCLVSDALRGPTKELGGYSEWGRDPDL